MGYPSTRAEGVEIVDRLRARIADLEANADTEIRHFADKWWLAESKLVEWQQIAQAGREMLAHYQRLLDEALACVAALEAELAPPAAPVVRLERGA